MIHTPTDPSKCEPSLPCPQLGTCIRAGDWPQNPSESVLDFSVTKQAGKCWNFIDVRGINLIEVNA